MTGSRKWEEWERGCRKVGSQTWYSLLAGQGTRSFLTSLISGLELLKPTDDVALVGNDLRLPDERNGHGAHNKQANDEDDTDL